MKKKIIISIIIVAILIVGTILFFAKKVSAPSNIEETETTEQTTELPTVSTGMEKDENIFMIQEDKDGIAESSFNAFLSGTNNFATELNKDLQSLYGSTKEQSGSAIIIPNDYVLDKENYSINITNNTVDIKYNSNIDVKTLSNSQLEQVLDPIKDTIDDFANPLVTNLASDCTVNFYIGQNLVYNISYKK